MATIKKISTVEELAVEMDNIAKKLKDSSTADKEAILKEMDRLALDAAHLTSGEAVKLRTAIDVTGKMLADASEAGFESLATKLENSTSEIINNINEVRDGQERWGNRLMDAVNCICGKIDSIVSTKVIVIISVFSIIVGTIVGVAIRKAASKVVEQLYDVNMTPIGTVPAFSKFTQVGLGISFGVLAAIIVFCVAHGITKLIVRAKERK